MVFVVPALIFLEIGKFKATALIKLWPRKSAVLTHVLIKKQEVGASRGISENDALNNSI